MFKRLTSYVDRLLHDGGPSSSRFINIGVFVILSVAMLKLTWTNKDEPGLYYWACFTTLAVYGMGVATFNKWLSIIQMRLGVQQNAQTPPTDPK